MITGVPSLLRWWSASWVVTSTFHSGLTVIDKAILFYQLSTRAAVKKLDYRARTGAVGSPRADSELRLRLSF